MIAQNLIKNWKIEHALSYVFLSVANSDCDIDKDELLEIKNTLYIYTKSDEITIQFLKEILPLIQEHDLDEKKEVISLLKSIFFKERILSNDVLDIIEEIIIADMVVEDHEMQLYHYIKRIFKS